MSEAEYTATLVDAANEILNFWDSYGHERTVSVLYEPKFRNLSFNVLSLLLGTPTAITTKKIIWNQARFN